MNRAEFMSRLAALLQNMPPAEREEAIQYYNDYFDDAGEGNEAGVIASLGSPEELAKSIQAGLLDGGNGGEFTESGFHGYEQRNKNQVMSTNQSRNGNDGPDACGPQTGGFQGNPYGQQSGTGEASYGQQKNGADARKKKTMSGGKIALLVLLVIVTFPVWIGILGGLLGGTLGVLGSLLGIFLAFLLVGVVLTVVGIALVIAGIAAMFGAPLGGLCLIGGGLIMVAVGLVFVWLMVLVTGTAIPALIRGIVNLCGRLFHRGGERA